MDAPGLSIGIWLLVAGVALAAVIACLAVVALGIEYGLDRVRLRRELLERRSRLEPVDAAKALIARKAA